MRFTLLLRANLCSEDEVVIPEITDPEDDAELLVPERDHGMVAEDDCFLSQLRSRQFREDQANHEGLDETTKHRLKSRKRSILLVSFSIV